MNETVNAVVTSEAADGVITYTATAELEGNIYTATKTVVNPKLYYFPKHSLTLNGDIGVNFYLNLSETELEQGVRADFAWNGKSDSVTFDSHSAPETKAGAEGLYKATCYVCAAEMNDEITVSVTVGDSTEPTATETYKVRDYADVIIENKDGKFSDALIALVKTMLNYGAAAQNQFSHNIDTLANAEIGYDLVVLNENEINGITGDVPDKEAINALLTESGIEYYGYSLILKTKTTLRFYFKKNGADTSQLALVNGDNQNIGTVKDYNDAYCFIEIEGIPAYELSDCYTLKYGDISLGSFSALSYVKDVLQNDNGAHPITDTVTALYRYNEAAKNFFDHPTPGQEETDIRPGN